MIELKAVVELDDLVTGLQNLAKPDAGAYRHVEQEKFSLCGSRLSWARRR